MEKIKKLNDDVITYVVQNEIGIFLQSSLSFPKQKFTALEYEIVGQLEYVLLLLKHLKW